MRRDDFSSKKPEWQVVDSTPIIMCDGNSSYLSKYSLHLMTDWLILFRQVYDEWVPVRFRVSDEVI